MVVSTGVDMQQSRRNADQSRTRGPQTSGPSFPGNSDAGDDAVARRAYQRFEERGAEHGRDMDDWLEAERELRRGEQAGRNSERSSDSDPDGSNEAA
jgi:hypothetical protein